MVAAERGTRNDPGFLDDHIATGFDAAVPVLINFVIQQTDVAAALRALAGLGRGDCAVGVTATKASDVTRWLDRVEEPHQERLRWRHNWSAAKHWLEPRSFSGGVGIRIRILARNRQARHRTIPNHTLAGANLEIGTTRPALRGNHERGLGLGLPALRASYLDAMALGLIGHGGKLRLPQGVP